MIQPGQVFRTYRLEQEIARGGQGVVYRALHSSGTPLALKLLRGADREAVKRFAQEARVLARLTHPNVLRVYEYGDEQGTPFLATEWIEGLDLKAFVATHGVPPLEWTARVVATLGHTLDYCHTQGVVHRDLKPANVLIETRSGRPVLVDFGLVKRDAHVLHLQSLDQQSLITQSETIKGTPNYMAPEQVNPKEFGEVTPATDVYGLGATLYHALTGKAPFEGRAAVVVMRKVTRKAPSDPRELNPSLPVSIAELCLQALAKAPSERPETPGIFAQRLAQAAGVAVAVPQPHSGHASPSGRYQADVAASGATRLPQSAVGDGPEAQEAVSLPKRLPQPGETLAGCLIERELARGGGGAVYVGVAEDGSRRAIKVLLGDIDDETKAERFAREADVGRELKHPGVVRVYAHGVERGLAYLVMEFLDNARPLDDYCAEEQVSVAGKIKLLEQVADAVQAAHEVGLVHRDLKPDNVLVLADGQVRVLDFGIARHVDKERLTMSGAMLGTLHYMAPEQVEGRGASADARTDVYAMGVMLYQLISGQLPFEGGTGIEVMAAILTDTPPDPTAGHPDAPPGLKDVIAMAMAREPERRYASSVLFGRDLAAATSGSGHVSAVAVAKSRKRHRRWVAVLGGVAAAVLLTVLALFAVKQARRLSDEDLAKGLKAVYTESWSLLTDSEQPLNGQAEAVAKLRAEFDRLMKRRPDAEGSDAVVRSRRRLIATEGLVALARDESSSGQRALSELGSADGPAVDALRGAVAAVDSTGEPRDMLRALSRSLARGLDRPELRGWRLTLHLRGGIKAAAAEEVLSDVEAREAAGVSAQSPDRWAKAWALLALSRIEEAARTADDPNTPQALRWAVALARVGEVVETNPNGAEAILARLAPPPQAVASQASALRARALAKVRELTSRPHLKQVADSPEQDEMRALATYLRIVRLLAPGESVSDPLVEAVLRHATPFSASGSDGEFKVGLAICALRPDDERVHTQVTSLIARVYSDASVAQLIPVAERAVALASSPAKRLEQGVVLVRAYARVCESLGPDAGDHIARCIAAANELAPEAEGGDLGWILAARAWAHFYAGNYRAAITDIDHAIEVSNEIRFFYRRARILHAAKVRPEQALNDAREYVISQGDAAVRVEIATAVAWDLGKQLNRLDALRRVIAHGVELRPYLAGWWTRLAWVQARLDDDRVAASNSLRRALEWFEPGRGVFASKRLYSRCLTVLEGYRTSSKWPEADAQLEVMVEELEAMRARDPERRRP